MGLLVEEQTFEEPASASPVRRLLSAVGLILVVITALLGSNLFGWRDRLFGSATPAPTAAASSRTASPASPTTEPERTRLRSQPWWQAVTTLEGSGSATPAPFSIVDNAVQWRVRWSCDSGQIRVQVAGRPKPLVDGACPNGKDAFMTQSGLQKLQITASGPWKLQVEQQVDVPLIEPPLPEMTAPGAAVVSSGSLYRIDQSASGTATIYRLPDGSHALRLEDFFVSPNVDLEVRLSVLPEPKSSDEYAAQPSELISFLDVTTGALNFRIPATIDPVRYGSLVIWCQPVHSAYGAARLGPPA